MSNENSPEKDRMSLGEGHFWIALTIFGTGLYLMKEDHLWGGLLVLVGVLWLVYSLRHALTAPKSWRLWIVGFAMAAAAITTGYDIYQRATLPAIGDIKVTETIRPPSLAPMPPKSRWLKLDDGEKWRLAYSLRYTTLAENGERLSCPFTMNISSDDQWHPEESALGSWAEMQPILEFSSWRLGVGQSEGHPHYSPGLTILIGADQGNMLRCASNLARLLQDAKIMDVSVRKSQITLGLSACKNECVELDFGTVDVH